MQRPVLDALRATAGREFSEDGRASGAQRLERAGDAADALGDVGSAGTLANERRRLERRRPRA